MKRFLLVFCILALALLPSCKTEQKIFAHAGDYDACVVSAIDADGKTLAEVAAIGAVVVRIGGCNGTTVNADMSVRTQLWFHDSGVSGPGDDFNYLCGDSGLSYTASGPHLYATAQRGTGSPGTCPTADTDLIDGWWFARTVATASLYGVEFSSGWITSPIEYR